MEYTKGEWKTYKNALGTWAVSTDSESIAQVERHYNAQLIVAAPDLYEALTEIAGWLKYNADLVGADCEEKDKLEVVNKALAKAEGK